jgi:hypothetical protein
VIILSATGYIRVHAYTSDAQIPLKDVAVSVTDPNGEPIALRLTNRSGYIEPITVSVPDRSASQTPDTGIIPYTSVNIYAILENYEQIEVENVQVFAGTVTTQNLAMIPLAELPDQWNKAEIFRITPQNL